MLKHVREELGFGRHAHNERPMSAHIPYGQGWLNQVLVYVLTPLFVYVVAAFLIAAVAPDLAMIEDRMARRALTLSDFAAFILLCLAGALVLLQMQLHAHGIVRGIESGLGQAARLVAGRGIGGVMRQAGSALAPAAGYGVRATDHAEAMQNRILSNSMLR